MLNKHQQRTEATKAKLLVAAERVFGKCGFEAATIDQIARKAGFTRGAFYAHFKTKEDLFFAMLEERARDDLRQLRQALESAPQAEIHSVLWETVRKRIRDTQWTMLQIEFKLYIARRGVKGAKIGDRFHALRENLRQQYLQNFVPANETIKSLFEAITDGLSLQRAYKPSSFSQERLEETMRFAFGILLNAEASPAGQSSDAENSGTAG